MSGRDLAGGVAPPAAVRGALELLGVRRLLLGIHDAAFPADPEGDLGWPIGQINGSSGGGAPNVANSTPAAASPVLRWLRLSCSIPRRVLWRT